METGGPFGIVDGKINGQGILRKVLPLLWELPMAAEAEYDGISVVSGESASLNGIPEEGTAYFCTTCVTKERSPGVHISILT